MMVTMLFGQCASLPSRVANCLHAEASRIDISSDALSPGRCWSWKYLYPHDLPPHPQIKRLTCVGSQEPPSLSFDGPAIPVPSKASRFSCAPGPILLLNSRILFLPHYVFSTGLISSTDNYQPMEPIQINEQKPFLFLHSMFQPFPLPFQRNGPSERTFPFPLSPQISPLPFLTPLPCILIHLVSHFLSKSFAHYFSSVRRLDVDIYSGSTLSFLEELHLFLILLVDLHGT